MLYHCVKNVRIRSFSAPYIAAFGINTEQKKHFSRADIVKLTTVTLPTCNFYTITCRFSYEDRAIMKFAYLTDTEGIDKNDRNHEW